MARKSFLNLTYSFPSEDFQKCAVFSHSGRINVKETLESMRNLLMQNIDVINDVLDFSNRIRDVEVTGMNLLEISADNSALDDMRNRQLIISHDELTDDSPETTVSEQADSPSDTETHSERLDRIIRLCNTKEISELNVNNEDSDDSDNEYIDDEKFRQRLRDKCEALVEQYKDDSESSDSSSDSD